MLLIKATEAHLREAAANLTDSDLMEFNAMEAGRDLTKVLTDSLDANTYTVLVGREVLAVGGHSAMGIWFVTTKLVHTLSGEQRGQFYRILKGHLAWLKLQDPYPKTNWVSVDNHDHIRLLTKLGASFAGALSRSPAGCAFKQFWL